MALPKTGFEIGPKAGIARCPRCLEFIDASVQVCRFCNAVLNADEMRAAAAVQEQVTLEKSQANNRRSRNYAIVVLLVSLIALPVVAAAKGIVLITYGETITQIADIPPGERDLVRTATGQDGFHVGYVYRHWGIYWLDLWTWDGTYCLFKDRKFRRLQPATAAAILRWPESDLRKPWTYTFPPGLVIVAVLAAGLGIGGTLLQAKPGKEELHWADETFRKNPAGEGPVRLQP